MQISLNSEMARFVEEQVKSGRFDPPADVVNGALARLQTEEELSPEDLEELRAEIAVGIQEADPGEVGDWDINELRSDGQRLLAEGRKRCAE